MPGRDWAFGTGGANDQTIDNDLPWRTARVGWVLNSPGFIEVDLLPEDVSDNWTAGNHRLHATTNAGGTLHQSTYLTHLSQFGPPEDPRFRAAGVGLEYIFDWRIVHNEWAERQTVPQHLETLLDDLQVLQGGGDMGFDSAVAATGTFTNEPLLSTCLGVVAADFIRELAGRGAGFDWWIDISQDPAVLSIAKPTRGSASGQTIGEENCQGWTVEFDTSDLLTTVTALGEQSDPWGPRHNLARTGLGDVYGRHEIIIDTDHGGEGDADEVRAELYDAAYEELSRRAGARLQVHAKFVDGHPNAPWTLGDVEVGDTATVNLPSYFGGNQTMRCTEASVSLEPAGLMTGNDEPGLEILEYVFDTLIEDITEGAVSS